MVVCDRGWSAWSDAELSKNPEDVACLGGELEPLHPAPTVRADCHVDEKHVTQEVRPGTASGGELVPPEEAHLACTGELGS